MSPSSPLHKRRSALGVGLLALLTFGAGIVAANTLGTRSSAAHPAAPSGATSPDGKVPPGPTAREAVAAQTNGAQGSDQRPVDMAEERRRRLARHELAIAGHATEPLDEPWAKETTAALRRDFQRIGSEANLTLIDLDCRSATCLATVQWPTAGIAWQKWSPILHHPYAAPCGVEVALGEAPAGDAPFRSVVVLTCRSSPPPQQGEGTKP